MRNAIHFLGGSVTVYVLMAACSAGSKGKAGEGDEMAVTSGGAAQSTGGVASSGGVDGVPDPTAGKPSGMGGIGGIIGEMMDPVPDANANESGSRLKARYYVGADGSKQFTFMWHDTQRNEDCTFSRVNGSELRCIPGGLPRIYFADAGCTAPLWVTAKAPAASCYSTSAAKYGTNPDASGCPTALHILTAAAPTMIYSGSPGACIGSAASDALSYFTSGGTIAWSEFVAATDQVQ